MEVPNRYLEDKPLPTVPVATMQSETSAYMVELFGYADDCKKDKQSIKKILEKRGNQ